MSEETSLDFDACIRSLKEQFPKSTVVIPDAEGVNPDGSKIRGPRTVPRFLFRGENADSSNYPTTCSAWRLLETEKQLDDKDRCELRSLTQSILEWLCSPESQFGLPEHDMFGLVQHLGLPTGYIDFSADIDVAGAFAVGQSLDSDGRAAICVLEVERAIGNGCG